MSGLPVMLQLSGTHCVIVGGGAVAVRRARALLEAGAKVTVISPIMDPRLVGMEVKRVERGYERGDLAGARVVVIATDDAAVNQAAADEARAVGAWVNRADDAAAGDFTVPAHARRGPLLVAVDTAGISAGAGAKIRDEMLAGLDHNWVRLLEIVGPYRAKIKTACEDAARRRACLQKLTDSVIMDSLKRQGEQAVVDRCEEILREAGGGDTRHEI